MFMDIRKNKKNNKIKIELPSAIGLAPCHVQTMMMKVLKQKNEGGNTELVKHTVN